ncbi:MAG: leucine--tRNA ligase, partial [Phycisphaerae bacterium]|nr:leucine--tRNA ligase [Phycisphaerae bacterium]
HRIGHTTSITTAPWPAYDPAQLVDSEIELPIQIQGKLRTRVKVPSDATPADIERIVLESAEVRRQVEGKTIRKVIVVPGRMVNLVVG